GLPAPRWEPETAFTSTKPSSSRVSRWRRTAAAVRFSFLPIVAALTGPCESTACITFPRVVCDEPVVEVDLSDEASAKLVTMICPNYRQVPAFGRSEEHTSELQSRFDLVCRLL